MDEAAEMSAQEQAAYWKAAYDRMAARNIELTNRLADSGGQRTERDDGLRDRASSSERAMERGGSSFSG